MREKNELFFDNFSKPQSPLFVNVFSKPLNPFACKSFFFFFPFFLLIKIIIRTFAYFVEE
jgi:hypothetical protein